MSHPDVRSLVLLLCLALACTPAASAQGTRPPSTLQVLVTVAPGLPEAARVTMLDEASAIWARQNVVLQWMPGAEGVAPAAHQLRLLVVSEGRRTHGEGGRSDMVVAELIRPANSHPMAFASIKAATRVVMDSALGANTSAPDPYRVGLVLGRAVAHEIGHFLLASPGHAPSGLMRADFNMRDFADPRSRAFHIDRETALELTTRMMRDAEGALPSDPADEPTEP